MPLCVFFFRKNRGVDVENSVIPILEPFYNHGRSVGISLSRGSEQLFPYKLGRKHPFGLVGEGVLIEHMYAVLGKLVDFLHKTVKAVAVFGRHGHNGGKIVKLVIFENDRQKIGFSFIRSILFMTRMAGCFPF